MTDTQRRNHTKAKNELHQTDDNMTILNNEFCSQYQVLNITGNLKGIAENSQSNFLS